MLKSEEFLKEQRFEGSRVFFIRRSSSIPQQIKRASLLVREAFLKGVLLPTSSVLIIGGGVSGISAALTAAELGIDAVVVEWEEDLFPLQARCSTRLLHPHEYNWPQADYLQRSYPMRPLDKLHCPPQLHWSAAASSIVAAQLRSQVWNNCPDSLQIRIDFKKEKRRVRPTWSDFQNYFDPHGLFDFYFLCAGGSERQMPVGEFRSYDYWENDPFEHLDSVSSSHEPLRVLISGGGDGGLQDFLRITCHPRDGSLFEASKLLGELLSALNLNKAFRDFLHERPQRARPQPATMWDRHNKLVDDIIADHGCWKEVCARLIAIVGPLVLNGAVTISLIFERETFSDCFALNSFLVHLVARYLQKEHGIEVLRPELGVASVRSQAHLCRHDAADCFGKTHVVQIGRVTHSSDKKVIAEDVALDFEVIILRLGSVQVAPRSLA